MTSTLIDENTTLLTPEMIAKLDPKKIPNHVAFIPDGNRRWAKRERVFPEKGHQTGADSLMDIVMAGKEMGIETLTFFIFSTENWNRPKREIKAQMWLLEKYLIEQKPRMIENGVKFTSIGELSRFSSKIQNLVAETVEATEHCHDITVVFAMNYGGRDDLCRAFKKIGHQIEKGEISSDEIDESLISRELDTAQWDDPDLFIRTSGEYRLSNFLLWQLSYSEIYLAEQYWPDFKPKHFLEAVLNYQTRNRRFGGS